MPFLVFAAFVVWMLLDWRGDPYDPALKGTAAYGHNSENALSVGIAFASTELVVFYLLTWPFLIRRPRWFFVLPLLGIVGIAVWAFLSMVFSMHAGGIVAIHFLWVVALGVLLVLETIISAVSGFASARRVRDLQP